MVKHVLKMLFTFNHLAWLLINLFLHILYYLRFLLIIIKSLKFLLLPLILFLSELKFEIVYLNQSFNLFDIILWMISFVIVYIQLTFIFNILLFFQFVFSECQIFPHYGIRYLPSDINCLLPRLISSIKD
jgi:hypothetical protein